MPEISYPWDWTTFGDSVISPYSLNTLFNRTWATSLVYDRKKAGVIRTIHATYSSLLEVSVALPSTITVANGAAIVDGNLYTNDASVTLAANDGYNLVGLRKDHAAQTIRLFVRGPYATEKQAEAAVITSDDTYFEIPLATVFMDSTAITVTDKRMFVPTTSMDWGGGPFKIAETIVGAGGVASVVFSFTTATYTHLLLRINATGDSSTSGHIILSLNGDVTPANYETMYFEAGMSAHSQGLVTTTPGIQLVDSLAYTPPGTKYIKFATSEVCLFFCRSTTYKIIKCFSSKYVYYSAGAEVPRTASVGGIWKSNSVVNQITLTPEYGNFEEFSTFRLYAFKMR